MKNTNIIMLCVISLVIALGDTTGNSQLLADNSETMLQEYTQQTTNDDQYTFPEFYRGIYLNYWSGKNIKKLTRLINKALTANINAMVIDIQPARNNRCSIPKKNISLLLEHNIHPIARIVCFNQGLKRWPVKDSELSSLISLAESACQIGFKEIQFDYIRFNDSHRLKKLSLEQKYSFIQNFLKRARQTLEKYDVKIAADVFGRIPLNQRDIIGQRIEVLDEVVDFICPMAYPSHYTWSNKMQKDPYYTVHLTSKKAKERTKKAEIVSWIQAFQMRVKKSGLTYEKYISEQIRATHDAGIRGFLLWNARQDYKVPFKVLEQYYKKEKIPSITTHPQKNDTADL